MTGERKKGEKEKERKKEKKGSWYLNGKTDIITLEFFAET